MPLLATFMVENFQPVPNASPDAICRLLEQGSPRQDEWFSMAAGALSHPQCGRYELGQDVVDSVQRVRQGKPRSVLSAVHLARSRHRVMWIEWATPDTEFVGDRVGWLVVEMPDETTIGVRFGLLPGSDPVMWGSASILPVMRDAVAPVVVNDDERSLLEETRTTIRDTLTPEAVKVKSGSMASRIGLFVPSLALEDIKAQLLLTKGYVGRGGGLVQSRQLTDRGAIDWSPDALDDSAEGIQAATELATTLLLLNSRNAVSIGEEPNYGKLDKQRARKGKKPLPPLRPVVMDITRRTRAARRAGYRVKPEDIRSALVSGHFKVRAPGSKGGGGGVFWWSPYIRSGHGERGSLPVAGRDYEVR